MDSLRIAMVYLTDALVFTGRVDATRRSPGTCQLALSARLSWLLIELSLEPHCQTHHQRDAVGRCEPAVSELGAGGTLSLGHYCPGAVSDGFLVR